MGDTKRKSFCSLETFLLLLQPLLLPLSCRDPLLHLLRLPHSLKSPPLPPSQPPWSILFSDSLLLRILSLQPYKGFPIRSA
jgi:hypothetical protein